MEVCLSFHIVLSKDLHMIERSSYHSKQVYLSGVSFSHVQHNYILATALLFSVLSSSLTREMLFRIP